MQSYFALIEDVFNSLLGPPWPLYVSDGPQWEFKNIYLFVTKGIEHSDLLA